MVEDKLQSFKHGLSEDNASSLESGFKFPYTFENECNKRQHGYQEKVLESFSETQACNKLEKAAAKIKQRKTLINNSNETYKIDR